MENWTLLTSDGNKTMHVRYLGDSVCWTILDGTGRFYIGPIEDATAAEIALCDIGGGEMPLTDTIQILAVSNRD